MWFGYMASARTMIVATFSKLSQYSAFYCQSSPAVFNVMHGLTSPYTFTEKRFRPMTTTSIIKLIAHPGKLSVQYSNNSCSAITSDAVATVFPSQQFHVKANPNASSKKRLPVTS